RRGLGVLALEEANLRARGLFERREALADRRHLALRRVVVEPHFLALLDADDVRRRFELQRGLAHLRFGLGEREAVALAPQREVGALLLDLLRRLFRQRA